MTTMRRYIAIIMSGMLLAAACSGGDEPAEEPTPTPPSPPEEPAIPADIPFYKGTTMSFANYMQDIGLVYRENGVQTDPYESVRRHGANVVRLQLDMVPFDDYDGCRIDWQSYDRVVADARCAKAQGLDIVLTLKPDCDRFTATSTTHNLLPDIWQGRSDAEIGDALYDWVYESLRSLAEEDILPVIVAVGNEVNINFLSPAGGYDAARTAALLRRGHQAVRDYAAAYNPEVLSAVHVADPSKCDSFIATLKSAGATDYDIVAISYYPGSDIGHKMGIYASFRSLAEYFFKAYGKRVMVLETAYSFTTGSKNGSYMGDWCNNAYNYPDWNDAANAVNYSAAKQREWLRSLAEDIKSGGGVGLVTWGTESLPDEASGLADGHGKGLYTYPAAWAYGSTWENNSYWDFTDDNNLHEGIDWMLDVEE